MDIDNKILQTLLAVADRHAIENVLGAYCRAIDRLDLELLKSVYHPDGFDDHGSMKLNAHEFADQIIVKLRESCEYGMHTITQTVIEIKGDRATSEAYYVGLHIIAAGEQSIDGFFGPRYLEAQRKAGLVGERHVYICGGRYLDVLHKRDGMWRIFQRKMTNEFAICQPESENKEGVPAAFFTGSRRDKQDPAYSLTLE
jgi:SnoaL-like domain